MTLHLPCGRKLHLPESREGPSTTRAPLSPPFPPFCAPPFYNNSITAMRQYAGEFCWPCLLWTFSSLWLQNRNSLYPPEQRMPPSPPPPSPLYWSPSPPTHGSITAMLQYMWEIPLRSSFWFLEAVVQPQGKINCHDEPLNLCTVSLDFSFSLCGESLIP